MIVVYFSLLNFPRAAILDFMTSAENNWTTVLRHEIQHGDARVI